MAKQDSMLRATPGSRAVDHSAKSYVRFTLAQRLEHIVLLVSFTLLGLTGLPQKYAGSSIAEWFIKVLGGIDTIRVIHHASAIVFVLMAIYHFVVLIYKVFVLHREMSMLPGLRDATDAIGVVRFNLGLSKQRPALPRYGFEEKAEYWAMIWGTVVMAFTGFMLWNPILFTKILPGEVIPAAKAAHGAEAVLAVLAILVWHFYNVHVKSWNTSMWTGKLSEHAMAHEHGEELEQIKAGQDRPMPSPAVIRQRTRVIMPATAAVAVLLLGGLYWLATAEQTAITTVPTPSVKVFVPLPPTLSPTQAAAQIGKPIPHDIVGKEKCDTCHGPNGVKPFPQDHAGRPNESCQVCHSTTANAGGTPAPASATGAGPGIPHPIEGREDCMLCHKDGGLRPVPADHAGRANDTCTMCHKLNPGISGTPQAAQTPAAGSAATGAAVAIPHDLAGKEKCDTCHGPTGLKPFPKDHEGRSNDTCTACHKPAGSSGSASGTATPDAAQTPGVGAPTGQAPASAAGGAIPAISHTVAGRENCLLCHNPSGGLGPAKAAPQSHVGWTEDKCQTCHKPAQ